MWLVALQVTALAAATGLLVRRLATSAGAVVLLLVAAEGLAFAVPLVRVRSAAVVALDRLADLTHGRVVPLCERAVGASDLVASGIQTTDGFGSLSLGGYTRFLGLVVNGSGFGDETRLAQDSGALPARLDLLDLLNVSHVLTCGPIEDERFELVDQVAFTYLFERLTPQPRARLACPNEPRSIDAVMRQLERTTYDGAGRLLSRPPVIAVRWGPNAGEAARQAAERRFRLAFWLFGRPLLFGLWPSSAWPSPSLSKITHVVPSLTSTVAPGGRLRSWAAMDLCYSSHRYVAASPAPDRPDRHNGLRSSCLQTHPGV